MGRTQLKCERRLGACSGEGERGYTWERAGAGEPVRLLETAAELQSGGSGVRERRCVRVGDEAGAQLCSSGTDDINKHQL